MHDDVTLPLGESPSRAAGMPEARDQWGPFRLLARVGAGGFGEVYRAWDPNLEREVALKLLLPGAVGGDEEYKAMLREARAMASVQHENIVHVYGIDRHDGRVGFWTDFVKGKTLSALLGSQGPFGYREAALIGIDVSRALSAVHRANLLHRDIKAENVMREEGGRILLMDFGLSAGERTVMTQLAGTPNYMAPELFDGGKASVCTDIYAMGVLLYYLVIGEYPARLTGLSIQEAKIALGHRTPLMDLRSDLPEPFLRAVRVAMELDPHKRFASAGQLAENLAECLGSGFAPAAPPYAPAYTPTYAPATPAYTPTHTPPYAPVSAPPPPPPRPSMPAPPPPKPLNPPASWANLFGMLRNGRLSKRAKWALLGLTIFAFQKWFRSDPSPKHKSSISAPAAPDAPSDDSDDTDDAYAKANSLLQHPYKDSNIADAIKGFQQILDQDPKSAVAEAGLGSAYFTQYNTTHDPKLLGKAKEATSKAIDMNPKLALPYVTRARISAKAGQTDLAMQQAQKAIDLDPHSAEAYGALSQVYQEQGRTDDAITAVQKAIDLAPEDSASIWKVKLGSYYFAKGDMANAADQWKKGLENDPDNVDALFNLGLVNVHLGNLNDAHSDFEKAAAKQPDASTFSALGSVLSMQGNNADAVAMNLKATSLNPLDHSFWANLASAYQWSGKEDKALKAYAKAIDLAEAERSKTPNNPNLLIALAGYYASSNKPDKSLPLIRKSLTLAPGNPNVVYRAGESYEILGQRAQAIPLIVQALSLGYDANEFKANPRLASLRADSAFQNALAKAKGA